MMARDLFPHFTENIRAVHIKGNLIVVHIDAPATPAGDTEKAKAPLLLEGFFIGDFVQYLFHQFQVVCKHNALRFKQLW